MRTAVFAAVLSLAACAAPDPSADDTADDTDTTGDTDTAADTDTVADDTADDTDPAAVSWVDDVFRPYLEESCAGCHADPGYVHPPISEDLSHLVGVGSGPTGEDMPYVTPGEPEESFLWYKVNDRQGEVTSEGIRMPPPPDEEPLSTEALAAIEAWILAGAAP